jgi:hypothetical protein
VYQSCILVSHINSNILYDNIERKIPESEFGQVIPDIDEVRLIFKNMRYRLKGKDIILLDCVFFLVYKRASCAATSPATHYT